MSAVVDLDRDLDRVLGLAALSVGARSVVLFLLADDARAAAAAPRRGGRGDGARPRRRLPRRRGGDRPRRADPPPGALHEPRPGEPAAAAVHATATRVALAGGRPGQRGRASSAGCSLADAGCARRVRPRARAAARGFRRRGRRAARERRAPTPAAVRHGTASRRCASISQALSSTIKIDEMLAKMVDLTREIVPYDRCALFIVDPGGRDAGAAGAARLSARGEPRRSRIAVRPRAAPASSRQHRRPSCFSRPQGDPPRGRDRARRPGAGADPLVPRPAAAPRGGAGRGLGARRRRRPGASTPSTSTSAHGRRRPGGDPDLQRGAAPDRRAPGGDRRPDRAVQPPLVPGAAGRRTRARRAPRRAALAAAAGHRPLQEDQRHLRPPLRGQGPQGARRRTRAAGAARGLRRALRRRGVRDHPRQHRPARLPRRRPARAQGRARAAHPARGGRASPSR